MTRINVGIKPKELPSKLLLAEHREIKRIPNTINSGKAKIENIPDSFRLGSGHVKFFYDKMTYLENRYQALYAECVERGFNVTYYGETFQLTPNTLHNDYKPSLHDRQLIVERIESKGFKLLKS